LFVILHITSTSEHTATHQIVLLSAFRLTVFVIEETFHIEIIKEHEKFLNKLNMSALDSDCEWSISKSVLLINADILCTIDFHK